MNQRRFEAVTDLGLLGHALCLALIASLVATGNVAARAGARDKETNVGASGSAVKGASLRLVSVEPTPFFIREKDMLLQGADVRVENSSDAVEATLDVTVASQRRTTAVGKIEKGQASFRVYIPDTRKEAQAEFALKVNEKVQDSIEVKWQPARQWQVFMVPITHHDLGYTDTIENILYEYDRFYDDILRFCEQTDDWPEESKYRYTVEGTWSIQHYIENRPKEKVDKLARYMREGRIEVGALFGNIISALCGHEQLIRLMYPSYRLKREYGAPIRTGSITDVPGLSWGLPTVLAGAGARYFFAGLPTYFEWGRNDIHTFWDEAAILRHGRPDAFRWQGPDGESVLVFYQGSYGFFGRVTGPNSYEEVMARLPGMLKEMDKQGCPFDVVRYIHNGVDNCPPDVKISHVASEWNSKWAYPKLIVATNSMFFEELEKQCQDICTFRGELPHTDYVVGAISTAKETALNRTTHDRLLSAEKCATIASLVADYRYPAEQIRQAYDCMQLYDEHTWGRAYPAGKEQDWSWSDKSRYAYKAAGLAEPILQQSLQTIADRIELKEQVRHIVVFNPLSIKRADIVKVPRFDVEESFDLIDETTGQKVPHQIVQLDSPLAPVPYAAHRYARGQFERKELFELVFVAEDVPAVGYKTYRLSPKKEAAHFSAELSVGKNTLENRFFKVTLDPQTGAVKSIYDKELSKELVDTSAPHKVNQFVARWIQTGKIEGPTKATIQKGQDGPVYGSLVVRSEGAGCPQLIQEIILYDKIKRIDFANRVLKDSTPLLEIYFAFPFHIDNPDFRFEGSDSVIKPLRDQFPGSNTNYYTVQHWADVSDSKIGITLSSVESHLLEFGGLWPCYVSQAHHGVTPPGFGRDFVKASEMTKGHMYAFVIDSNFRTNFQPVQQGDMLFRYALTTHKGDWQQGRPRDFGWATGSPLIGVMVDGKRQGPFEQEASFCQVDKPNVFLLTLKRAEDGDGIILRLIETEGKEATVTVTLPHIEIEKALRTNLVEENEGPLRGTAHTVTAPVKAFGITTIRIKAS
jgi:alpha-mannosidase